MTDCKSPLEVIMSHEYCFGDLGEELEKWKDRKFPYRNKVKKPKIMHEYEFYGICPNLLTNWRSK